MLPIDCSGVDARTPHDTSVLSAGGSKLLSASGDSTVKVWDFATKELERTLVGHIKDCTGLATCDDVRAAPGTPPA